MRLFAINLNQNNYDDPAQMPNAQFPVTRLWDTGVTWRDIEKTAGQYDFAQLDKELSLAQVHGVREVIYTAGKTPAFYGGGATGAGVPTDNSAYTAFVVATVNHITQQFPSLVLLWEQWNEPNLQQFWLGNPAQLLALNRAAYSVLHALGIRVLSPSGSGGTAINNFILTYLTACANDYPFDIFAYHAYLHDGQRTPTAGLTALLNDIKVKKNSFGISSMATWFTEGSWGQGSEYTPPLTPVEFRTYLVTMYSMMKSQPGVEVFAWYAWNNSHDFGVLASGTPVTPNLAGVAWMTNALQ